MAIFAKKKIMKPKTWMLLQGVLMALLLLADDGFEQPANPKELLKILYSLPCDCQGGYNVGGWEYTESVDCGPFLFNKLMAFVKQQGDAASMCSIQVHYHRVDPADRDSLIRTCLAALLSVSSCPFIPPTKSVGPIEALQVRANNEADLAVPETTNINKKQLQRLPTSENSSQVYTADTYEASSKIQCKRQQPEDFRSSDPQGINTMQVADA
ncbi:hypothetical protein STEG23_003176 [Scotinomys teguina]